MSGEKTVAEKVHATLGASSASRWMACPGSVRLSREVNPSGGGTSSAYAEEGTRAHSVAELALNKGVNAQFFIGMDVEGVKVDDDMGEYVDTFVQYCFTLKQECIESWIERRFNLSALKPPAPMFGTADFVAYDAVSRTLHVVDLKYGAGVVVEARGNKQLRYYGLGAALSLDPKLYPIEHVRLTIIQPRVGHPDGVIRHDDMTYVELLDFATDLLEAAEQTMRADARLQAGSHCRFCAAAGVCPEQREHALSVAQNDFMIEPDVPPAPETMPIELVVEMLPKLPLLQDWINAMHNHVRMRLERGEDVPGYKLVAKRATRKWADPNAAEQWLVSQDHLSEDEIFQPRDLKSVAQIEKLLTKKVFNTSPLVDAVVKVSSGYNMAPVSDPRPAVQISAGEEFALLTTGDE